MASLWGLSYNRRPRFHHRTSPSVTVGDKVPGAWLVLFLIVISVGVGEETRPPASGADRPAPWALDGWPLAGLHLSASKAVPPYPWFHFPQLPVGNCDLKILNGKFQKWAILVLHCTLFGVSVVMSLAAMLRPTRDMNHPLAELVTTNHLAVPRSALCVTVLCSSNPPFT